MNDLRESNTRFSWLWIASIWFALGLFDSLQSVVTMRAQGMHHAWVKLFFTLFLGWMPLVVVTPWVVRLGQQYPLLSGRRISHWAIHLSACAVVCIVSAGFVAALEAWWNPWANPSGPEPFFALWLRRSVNSIVAYIIFYASILAISYMLASKQRLAAQQTETARLNEQLSRAHLAALRRQIEPHFLFNALNAIAGLVRENRNDDAVGMIAGLSDFLRHVIQDSDRHEVPLSEEMQFLEKYLQIQKIRFADRLEIRLDIPDELHCAQVPSLLLQPVVENAIKHGVARRAHGGAIRIAASRTNGTLQLTVYNDGPSLEPNWQQTQMGVGITNLQTRLRGLYGDRFELELHNHGAGGVETSISLPYKEA